MFSFYAAPAVPFLVLAVVYVLGALIAPAGARRGCGGAAGARATRATSADWSAAIAAGAYVLLVALCFAYFYPIFVGQLHAVRGLVGPDVAGRPLDLSTDRRRAARRDGRRARTPKRAGPS